MNQVDENMIYGFALGVDCQGCYNDVVPLSGDTIEALEELGLILRKIDRRMIAEGYEIVDGRVQKAKE